jgi:hypothetical protein
MLIARTHAVKSNAVVYLNVTRNLSDIFPDRCLYYVCVFSAHRSEKNGTAGFSRTTPGPINGAN